jgi:hypothetical protein
VSRISGTQRIQKDTKGHGEVGGRVQEDTGGAARIREDTTLGRFGTVRPRVQIPGPRPISYSKSAVLDVAWSRPITAGSQFPRELSRPRGASVIVVGGSELAW